MTTATASATIENLPPPKIEWRPIYTAPRDGRFDVWAKRWVPRDDSFEYRRFTDCYWRSTHVANCPKEWSPTHWCPIISPPAA